MVVVITLTTAGSDVGPFDLYSNVDGYTTAFETGVSKLTLIAGYISNLVPDGTTSIRVESDGVCTNYIDLVITGTTTTTTTTITPIVCISYSVEVPDIDTVTVSYYDCTDTFVSTTITGPNNLNFCAREGTVLTVPSGTSTVTSQGSCNSPIPFNYDYCSTPSSTSLLACGLGPGSIDSSLYGDDSTIPLNSYIFTDPQYIYPLVGNMQWYFVISDAGQISIQVSDSGQVINKFTC